MATLQSAIDFARAQAQTDANGLTSANGIIFANEALVDFHRRLVDHSVDASQLQEAYMSMTANQGTYLYPTDMLMNKAIELNYAGNTPSAYITATQVDVANLANENSFSYLRANASTNYPQFDDRGDWFEIFPTPVTASNQGIRMFYYLKPSEYTSTADTISYPESQDIRILGWRIAAMYYYSLNKMAEGDAFNMKYEERVRQYCSTLARGTQQPLQATPLQITGYEF